MEEAERRKYLQPLFAYLKVSNRESDRGRVLVAAAQLDSMLEIIVRSYLLDGPGTEELFAGPNAPMSSLFNKSNIARALSLISVDEHKAIDLVRKIRNEFAHSVNVHFEEPKVAALSMKLKFGITELSNNGDPAVGDPRARFGMSTAALVLALYNRAHYVEKSKCENREWPA